MSMIEILAHKEYLIQDVCRGDAFFTVWKAPQLETLF